MVKAKRMDESAFAKILKAVNVEGESIRDMQNEKEALMKSFEGEQRRYKSGKISRRTLSESSRKVNKELVKLDKKIRSSIARVGKLTAQAKKFASRQAPKPVRAKLAGVKSSSKKKRHRPKPKPKPVKKKPVKKAKPKPAKKQAKKKPAKKPAKKTSKKKPAKKKK
ncbi:hypothetical protein GF386_06370 [Candidatus Pacearchaeota archaeon]|nr:hypothetical protein [Candidatus Pacearchaeota archaeon]MBD3283714.1 hypothetical protein [Candidatus Pacearchaeota archaeon]